MCGTIFTILFCAVCPDFFCLFSHFLFSFRLFFFFFNYISKLLIFILFIFLFLAVLGLRFCARAFSSCGKRGPLLIAVRGPLTVAASPVAEHKLQTRRLSSCGSRAQLLRGMWDLPRPGLEPVSTALAGRFSTAAPPGKPQIVLLIPHFPLYYFGSYNSIFFLVITLKV